MNDMNRIWNVANPYQRQLEFKRVLCVCSAGLLRSPTAAFVLSNPPFNYNTRAAGLEDYALVPLDRVLIEWADEILVMNEYQRDRIWAEFPNAGNKQIVVLDIEDNYSYRDPVLMDLIASRYQESL